jgi:hypothetical protein
MGQQVETFTYFEQLEMLGSPSKLKHIWRSGFYLSVID